MKTFMILLTILSAPRWTFSDQTGGNEESGNTPIVGTEPYSEYGADNQLEKDETDTDFEIRPKASKGDPPDPHMSLEDFDKLMKARLGMKDEVEDGANDKVFESGGTVTETNDEPSPNKDSSTIEDKLVSERDNIPKHPSADWMLEKEYDRTGSKTQKSKHLLSYRSLLDWFGFTEPVSDATSTHTYAANGSQMNASGTNSNKEAGIENPEAHSQKACSGFGCLLKLSQKAKSIKCTPRNMTLMAAKREGTTMDDLHRVHVFSSNGRINEALKNRRPEQGDCILMLIFSPYCRFSIRLAPFINALPRAFPLLEVGAVDASFHRGVAHKFGVAGVPSLVLFQHNKMVAKLNDTEGITPDFDEIVKSVAKLTNLTVNESARVEDIDHEGPLKSHLVEETDIYLVISWAFLLFFAFQKFLRSDCGRSLVQSVLQSWRAAQEVADGGPNAHPHAD